jgi:hypothetical protein
MTIRVNRAPVLTLWAAVVAERLGYSREEALTMGRVVAGLNAYSKGRAIGLFAPRPRSVKEHRSKLEPGAIVHIDLLHRAVPAVRTAKGLRAVSRDRPVEPEAVERYLESKFQGGLPDVRKAMGELARALSPVDLAARAYELYEQFRPRIPPGVRGWGAAGDLDLDLIRSLAGQPRAG